MLRHVECMGIKALVADRPRRVQSPHPACSPYRPRHVLGASGPLTARSRTVALGDRRPQRHPPRVARLSPSPTLSAGSGRVPRQPLDAPENLPKEVARQVVLGQLEDEVPRMPDQATARLEEPLLETCKRPTLHGWGQDEPSQQIAEVVGDHSEQQADLIHTEAVAREARPMGGFLALYKGTAPPRTRRTTVDVCRRSLPAAVKCCVSGHETTTLRSPPPSTPGCEGSLLEPLVLGGARPVFGKFRDPRRS